MSKLIRLQPASRMAVRVTQGEDFLTVQGEEGPRCICGSPMRPIPGQEPCFVRCVQDGCSYCNLAFKSPVAGVQEAVLHVGNSEEEI